MKPKQVFEQLALFFLFFAIATVFTFWLIKKRQNYLTIYSDYQILQEKYDKQGKELEGIYMDLVQCQRVLGRENPWQEMIDKK